MRLLLPVLTLLALSACAGSEVIVHSLDELEANEVLVVLERRGIMGSKVKEEGRVVTWGVEVSGNDARKAMSTLSANKLPKRRTQGLKEVYPPGGGGLIPTKSEEKAKYVMAIQGEVERSLLSLPGIMQAHVAIVTPDKDVVRDLDTPPPLPTASVAIVYNAIDNRGTAAVREDEVKAIVASSVEDLKTSNVTVVMKQNAPTLLVEPSVAEAVTAATKFGLSFSDTSSAQRLTLYGLVALIIALLSIAVGISGIVRSMSLASKLRTAQGQLASYQKAKRETQTGLQQGG